MIKNHIFNINHIHKYTAFLITLIVTCVLIWGLNKGFDITDEGFYLLGFQENQELGISVIKFHHLIKPLFWWLDLNILNLRVMRLALLIFSAFLLTLTIKRVVKKKIDLLFTFSLLLLSALLTFTFGPKSLSYNSLSSSFIIFSFCFGLIALNTEHIKYKYVLTLLSGLFLAFCFFIKPSAAFIYAFFYSLFIIYEIIYHKQKNWIPFVLFIAAGWIAGNCLYFIIVESPLKFYHSFVASYAHITSLNDGHGIKDFNKGIFQLFDEIFSIAGFLCFLLIAHFFTPRYLSKKYLIICNSFLGVILLLYYYNNLVVSNNNAAPFLLISLGGLLYFLFQVITTNKKFEGSYSLVFMLFMLPFIGAFGTNNALISNAMYMIILWAALMIYLVYSGDLPFYIKRGLLYTFLITSTVVFYNYYLKFPYRINSLDKQVVLHAKSNIYLQEDLSKSIVSIEKILRSNNFKDGDPIIGMYKIPGLIYLLGGTSPGDHQSIWDHKFLDFYLHNLKLSTQDYSKSFILIKNSVTSAQIKKLNEAGINFPNEFIKLGNVYLYNYHKAYSGNCAIYAHQTKVSNLEDIRKSKELVKKGFDQYVKKEYIESIKYFDEAIKIWSNNSDAYNNLGMAYMKIKDYNSAVKFFKLAIKINPDYRLAKNNLNWAHSEMNKK